jgi:regulatory LuxR family protein
MPSATASPPLRDSRCRPGVDEVGSWRRLAALVRASQRKSARSTVALSAVCPQASLRLLSLFTSGGDASLRLNVFVTQDLTYHRELMDQLRRAAQRGADVRLGPEVPVMLAVDDLVAVHGATAPCRCCAMTIAENVSIMPVMRVLLERQWKQSAKLTDSDIETGRISQSILDCLAAGMTDSAAARHLGVSARTVRRHVSAIMAAVHVRSRFELGFRLGRSSAPEH